MRSGIQVGRILEQGGEAIVLDALDLHAADKVAWRAGKDQGHRVALPHAAHPDIAIASGGEQPAQALADRLRIERMADLLAKLHGDRIGGREGDALETDVANGQTLPLPHGRRQRRLLGDRLLFRAEGDCSGTLVVPIEGARTARGWGAARRGARRAEAAGRSAQGLFVARRSDSDCPRVLGRASLPSRGPPLPRIPSAKKHGGASPQPRNSRTARFASSPTPSQPPQLDPFFVVAHHLCTERVLRSTGQTDCPLGPIAASNVRFVIVITPFF